MSIKRSILIAGTEPKNIRLANVLKKVYYDTVVRTDDKKSILIACKELEPDVIILPLMLKDVDSLTLLNELKNRSGKTPYAIIISKYKSEMLKIMASSIGNVSILKTPFHYEILKGELENIFRKEDEVKRSDENGNASDRKAKIILPATKYIHIAGIPTNLKGYYYIRDAVIMCVEREENVLLSYTKDLCPRIAKMYNTTAINVKKSIRNAIKTAWNNGLTKMSSDMPTSFQLITRIADAVKMNLNDKN